MFRLNSIKLLALSTVLTAAFMIAGCNKGHNDNIQENGPDQLPMRLQLPKDGSVEGYRILQYQQDNVTRKLQQSVMKKGPYSGGRQTRIFDNDNTLREIVTYFAPTEGSPEQVGYRAIFEGGHYRFEETFNADGSRQTDGKRLQDGTFEQNTYATGGLSVAKHAIFGRLMNDQNKLEWKLFSDEQYRDDKTLSATQQRMDDNHIETKYFDEHNVLTESVSSDKAGTATSETDYRPDGKTPLVRYDFSTKIIWLFDEKGVVVSRRMWYFDESQQLTVYKSGVPVYIQDWEVDATKSDKNVTPAKNVLYLSWVKELNPDGSDGREIHYLAVTYKISTVTVPEAPPQNAKFKPADGPAIGSIIPAKNWVPLPPGSKLQPATPAAPTTKTPAPTPSSATATNKTPSTKAPTTTAAAAPAAAATAAPISTPTATPAPSTSPFWAPSGARDVFTYSASGNVIKVDSYKAGQSTATTVTHKESEHVRVRFNPALLKPLPAANHPPDKPKDPTQTASAVPFDLDDDN